MADFSQAFEFVIANEGGFRLHLTPGDHGGLTYAGIARKYHPMWLGWDIIDNRGVPDVELVRQFYRVDFWNRIHGDDISDQDVANSIFDFAVNASVITASRLAQNVVGVTSDGRIGPITLAAINATDPKKFLVVYALAKLARYRDIVTKDSTQQKFLLGWINRILRGLDLRGA